MADVSRAQRLFEELHRIDALDGSTQIPHRIQLGRIQLAEMERENQPRQTVGEQQLEVDPCRRIVGLPLTPLESRSDRTEMVVTRIETMALGIAHRRQQLFDHRASRPGQLETEALVEHRNQPTRRQPRVPKVEATLDLEALHRLTQDLL